MKDIRLEVTADIYNTLFEFKNKLNLRTFGIKTRYNVNSSTQTIIICTDRPGIVIGYHGQEIDELTRKLNINRSTKIKVEVEELDFFITVDNESYTEEEHTIAFSDYCRSHGF